MHNEFCVMQVHNGPLNTDRHFWRCPRAWYSHQPKNCGFTRWVDPPAIDPYQTYKLKQELAKALVLADRLSSEDDGEPKSASPSSMVFKTNTGCVDEWCCP